LEEDRNTAVEIEPRDPITARAVRMTNFVDLRKIVLYPSIKRADKSRHN
jgi:hypothetical protein